MFEVVSCDKILQKKTNMRIKLCHGMTSFDKVFKYGLKQNAF